MVSAVIDLENVDAIFLTLFLLLIRLWQRSKAKKQYLVDRFFRNPSSDHQALQLFNIEIF